MDLPHNPYLPPTSRGRILLTKRTEFRDQDRLERSDTLVSDIMANQSIEIPSLEAMEEDLRQSERNLAHITDRAAELEDEHLRNLSRIYDMHAHEYRQDALGRYYSFDETQVNLPGCENGPQESTVAEHIESLSYNRFMHSYLIQPWNEDIRREREAHQIRLAPWRKMQGRCNPTSFPIEATPSWPSTGMYTPGTIVPKTYGSVAVGPKAKYPFPQSVTAWNNMAQKDKFRVAKFLTAFGASKAKMEAEYGWSHEMVQRLSEVYAKDDSFRADVTASLITVGTGMY
ncbi:hypothetical protein IW261DRAFT_1439487 [Armillaria novae-zelandiae]|uniref:Uncharacterized protein n=1 Tax=Armillaria novae-zelandiae TaxID=153914 RepID=A0AA39PQ53_9AGAR|nr:hypothetical protein IW261DRAFT_1439487 [Armillaria novae-zelandiae]